MNFNAYDIVVVPFPFTDKQAVKHRPAVVISNNNFNQNHDHLLLAMITSAKQSAWQSDIMIQDWKAANLIVPCKIRFKLFSLPNELVIRCIGTLLPRDRVELKEKLKQYLIIDV